MLTAFTAGLLLITISELGDKTFFIAVILAMRHSHHLVYTAVMAALAGMTLLSVFVGQAIAFLPKSYTHYGAIALFLIFGVKLLFDAHRMSDCATGDVVKEAQDTLDSEENRGFLQVLRRFFARYPQTCLWCQACGMTFVAEWGDRTQISTIALAASHNPLGVTLGAVLGHGICTLIATQGGRFIAGRISERTITVIGGILFLIFGVASLVQGNH